MDKVKVFFYQSHDEELDINDEERFSKLRELLEKADFSVCSAKEKYSSDQLSEFQIVVIGAPKKDLDKGECYEIRLFMEMGGSLLFIHNSDTVSNLLPEMDRLCSEADIQFKEYLNYQYNSLRVSQVHYIMANVEFVDVSKKIASLKLMNKRPCELACSYLTGEPVIACSTIGKGRVVAIGDIGFFTNNLIDKGDNQIFIENTFTWLSHRNLIDIEEISIPEMTEWTQIETNNIPTVSLKLCNQASKEARPSVKCILDSDSGAIISDPIQTIHNLPLNTVIIRQWKVRPQCLGDQKLRLSLHINDNLSLYFDNLTPKMYCNASGHLNLRITDKEGNLGTTFQTDDLINVEGFFQWTEGIRPLPLQTELKIDKGLAIKSYKSENNKEYWQLSAINPGISELEFKISETDQSLPVSITINSSYSLQLSEIYTAYVCPLEAEIIRRLEKVDKFLADDEIRKQDFKVLPPEEYIREIYKENDIPWLEDLLDAAGREEWHNPDLITLILTYFVPTYMPGRGAFIPYDPKLASHLGKKHPGSKKRLEYNLLCSEESESFFIKQNIAAYLLHEKYGHGFFYTQTSLGRQLAKLEMEELDENSQKAVDLIKDSAIIVNEGFAAWMELTFLSMLSDSDVRQAVYPRRALLIEADNRLKRRSSVFETFPPLHNSRYREGFDQLDFISRKFGHEYAVKAFQLATNIHFEDDVHIRTDTFEKILQSLSGDTASENWCSYMCLRNITNCLKNNLDEVKALIRDQYINNLENPFESFLTKNVKIGG